jgi:hypothetical protein
MTTVEDVTVGVESPSELATARLTFRLFVASIVVAVVPVAVATTRAIHNGWIPTGDNALFAIRARDLFTHNLPLLGSWSSASLNASTQINHPGPLYFDLLAVPARLWQSGAGVAFGAALINVLCIVGIAVFAYRRGGAFVGTAVMAATAALGWSMGSEMLFEPWNPHSALLPFMFFLVLVWSVTCGDLPALPFAAATASLLVQTHLSYALIVPLLGAWGLAGLILHARAERRRDWSSWVTQRRRTLRFGIAAGVGLAVCWIQPLIEQFTSDGDGNLTRLVDNARNSKAGTIGIGFGTRVVATVVSLPPWWFRPSMSDAFVKGWNAPALGFAVLSLVVLCALLGWCAWNARRRNDRTSALAAVTAVVGVVAALITAWQGPVTVFGDVTPHTFRWLWPLGAFAFFALAVNVGRRLVRNGDQGGRTSWLVGTLVLVTVVVAALNLPFNDAGSGPNSQEYAIPATQELNRKIGSLEDQGPLLIDDLFKGVFADPYGGAVIAELQRRGIPFVAHDPGLVRQFGPGRVYDGHNAKAALLLRIGEARQGAPSGSHRVARGEGLSADDRRELSRLKARISAYIEAGELRLNSRGEAALARGDLPNLAELQAAGPGTDPKVLFDSRELDVMVQQRLLDVDGVWARRLERYADLHHRSDLETVVLFLKPLRPSGSS